MKLIIPLALASVALMVVMVAQVVLQELSKRSMAAASRQKEEVISGKEREIADLKNVLQGWKPKLQSMTKLTEEMKTKKENLLKEKETAQENLKKCDEEKLETDKGLVKSTEDLNSLKKEHDQAKNTSQTTIQGLKQKILDRDEAICEAVDKTNAEARRLCSFAEESQ